MTRHDRHKDAKDVTDCKRAEEDFREINEYLNFYRLAVDHMENYKVAVVDDSYRYKIVSRQYLEGYNLTEAELIGKAVAELLGEEIFESTVKPNLDRALKEGQVVYYADWFDIPAKGERYMEVSYYPIRGEDYSISSVAAISRDVTEQKKAEEDLRRREQEFRALAENAPDIVVRFDRGLRHLYVNPAVEKHTGIPREQFIGRTNEELGMPAEQVRLWDGTLREVFREGRETEMFFDYPTPGGRRYYHSRITPEFAPGGAVETVLSVNRDITAIKEMEATLYQERVKNNLMHQRSVPDELPGLPGLALAATYRPAAALQGDYYNGIRRPDQLLLYLVDIDKGRDDGVMQSLYVREAVGDYLTAHDVGTPVSPGFLLRYIAGRYREDTRGEAAPPGIFIAVFEQSPADGGGESGTAAAGGPPPGTLRYASAGFCTPPLAIKGAGEPGGPWVEDLCLAAGGGTGYPEHTLDIVPGSTFIFSTGGLLGQGPGRGDYGQRLQGVLRGCAHLPPELINQAVETDFDQSCGALPLQDDLAFIVAQVPQREQHISFTVESDFMYIQGAIEKVSPLLEQRLGQEPDLVGFYELLVNAIEHGNKRDGGKTVTVDLAITDRFYKVIITDQGEGFNWRDRINKEMDWDSEMERGRGIIMTRAMTDYLGYNERGNRVTMINLLGQN